MAKTDWNSPPKWLTPEFMVAFAGNNAGTGHNHEGTDDDGSCPKISIADSVDDYLTGTINVDVISTYFATPVNADWIYYKVGSIIHILIPEMIGIHATNNQLAFTPNSGNWPALMVPSNTQNVGGVILYKQDPSTKEIREGRLTITSVSSAVITASITNNSGILGITNFGTGGVAGQEKGIERQTISYVVD